MPAYAKVSRPTNCSATGRAGLTINRLTQT